MYWYIVDPFAHLDACVSESEPEEEEEDDDDDDAVQPAPQRNNMVDGNLNGQERPQLIPDDDQAVDENK